MARNPLLSPQRERQLVQMVQNGDRGALGELLGAYQKRVYHICLRMVSNRDDAAELAQEVLLRAIQHIDSFQSDSKFSTWLLRIAMNLSVSHLRKRKVRSAASLDGHSVGDNNDDQAAPLKAAISETREPAPEQSVETGEQLEHLMGAVETLDPPLKAVILLRDLQGMEYQQMAEVLSVPVGTVKSRLFRARLALRQAMEARNGARSEVTDG